MTERTIRVSDTFSVQESLRIYRSRIMDSELSSALSSAGAVLIEGPRACGKTETARYATRSQVFLDADVQARQVAGIDPSLVLEGETPRLIDEWQLVPEIWNQIRREVDERQRSGQFVLTGSAVPADDATRHVGAGRFIRLRMRPMTLFEAGHSSGQISMAAILSGEPVKAPDTKSTLPELAEWITVGGWPGHLQLTTTQAQRRLRGYVGEIARADVRQVEPGSRSPQLVTRLLRALARNVGTPVSLAKLRTDTNGTDGTAKAETVAIYLDALERLMVLENLEAWDPSLRSRTRLRATPVRHFVDPSLAVAALSASPDQLLRQPGWLGFLFENLAVRDLRVFAQSMEANVFHYRDESGLEADAIVELPDGWAAFEVKLGQGQIDLAAANLLKLRDRVDSAQAGECALLAVVTAKGYGYVRPDGVAVMPLPTLGP